jgi:hypothetical protein
MVPLNIAQCIIFKFLNNENVKQAEILRRLGAKFDDETLSSTPVYDLSNSFKEGLIEVENM